MPNFMHKLRITFYQNAAELLSAIYYESNATIIYRVSYEEEFL